MAANFYKDVGLPATSSDEVRSAKTTKLCEPCVSNCKEVTAVLYCLDCEEKFCDACGNCHKKSKLSKDHKLCNLTEAPPSDVVKLMKELTTCPNHQSEEVVYICIDEDELCCSQCANTKHRQCRKLETIEQCLKDGRVKKGSCTPKTPQSHVYMSPLLAPIQGSRYQGQFGFINTCPKTLHQEQFGFINTYPEKHEDINTLSKRICEQSNELDNQLENIVRHEVSQSELVSGTPEQVREYLQVVHAKLESAFNTLQTNLMAQCRAQTQGLLKSIQHQQTSASALRKQIKSNQEKMISIKKHGQDKHVFLICRKMDKDFDSIASNTRALENDKTMSSLSIVEQISVDNIVNNIVKALRIQSTAPINKSQRASSGIFQRLQEDWK